MLLLCYNSPNMKGIKNIFYENGGYRYINNLCKITDYLYFWFSFTLIICDYTLFFTTSSSLQKWDRDLTCSDLLLKFSLSFKMEKSFYHTFIGVLFHLISEMNLTWPFSLGYVNFIYNLQNVMELIQKYILLW